MSFTVCFSNPSAAATLRALDKAWHDPKTPEYDKQALLEVAAALMNQDVEFARDTFTKGVF